MTLDVNRVKQQDQVLATGINPAASTFAYSSNQPIDMTSGTMSAEEKRQQEIDFINSAEYKNCPDEDKAELLKQQFPYLRELPKEEFNKYLEKIKVAALEKIQTTSTETEDATRITTTTIKSKQSSGNLTPENKLRHIIIKYLNKHDTDFKNLKTEEEKEEYIQNAMAKIITLSKQEGYDAEKETEKQAFLRAVNLIKTAKENNLSLDSIQDIKTNNPKKLEEMMNKTFRQKVRNTYQKAAPAEKKDVALDLMLSFTDAEYNCIEDDLEKLEYRNKKLEEQIENTFDIKNLDALPEDSKQLYQDVYMQYFESVLTGDNLSSAEDLQQKMQSMPRADKLNLMKCVIDENSKLSNENKEDFIKKIDTEIKRLKLFGEEPISNAKRIKILEKLEKQGKLSEEDRQYLEILKTGSIISTQYGEEICEERGVLSNSDIATSQNLEFNVEYLQKTYKNEEFSAKNFYKGSSFYEEIEEMIHNAAHAKTLEKQQAELSVIKNFLKEKGIDESLINNLFNDEKAYAHHISINIVQGVTKNVAYQVMYGLGNEELAPRLYEAAQKATEQFTERNQNNPKELDDFSFYVQDNERVRDDFTAAIYEQLPEKNTIAFFQRMSKSDRITKANTAAYTESFINNVKTDDEKIKFADNFSKFGNSAILEGLAAGSDSIQDQDYRNQYNSIVTQAAQNYPPEVQQTIQTALTTGEISQETRNNTAPATSSYYSEADTYVPTTTQQNTSQTQTNSNHQNSPQSTNTSTTDYNTPVIDRGIASSNLDIPQTIIENTNNKNNTYNTDTRIKTNNTYSSNTDATKIQEQARQAQVDANQKAKDIALENIAEVKESIDKSIEEWELKQELKLSDEVIQEMKEIAVSEALEEYIDANPSQKEVIFAQLSKAESISEIYDILLSTLGSKVHQKFVDNLARGGSTGNIRAFLNSKAGNIDIIKQILLHTTSTTLKNELIDMLPFSDVLELLDKNLITTLESVDHQIIFTYVSKNIYLMTQINFANFLKYLPFDEREKLIAMRNKAMGIQPETTPKSEGQQQEVQTNPITQNQNHSDLTQEIGNANNQAQISVQNTTAQQNNPTNAQNSEFVGNPQTKFKAGETTKVLNDGRVITSQGTSFAGISNNQEEGFKVVEPKPKKDKAGAPIGMNDQVLVPGSQEWLMKYNKQAPKTAFTMTSMEDEQDEGLNFGSNRVKIGQSIKKKYNPNSFNIRG